MSEQSRVFLIRYFISLLIVFSFIAVAPAEAFFFKKKEAKTRDILLEQVSIHKKYKSATTIYQLHLEINIPAETEAIEDQFVEVKYFYDSANQLALRNLIWIPEPKKHVKPKIIQENLDTNQEPDPAADPAAIYDNIYDGKRKMVQIFSFLKGDIFSNDADKTTQHNLRIEWKVPGKELVQLVPINKYIYKQEMIEEKPQEEKPALVKKENPIAPLQPIVKQDLNPGFASSNLSQDEIHARMATYQSEMEAQYSSAQMNPYMMQGGMMNPMMMQQNPMNFMMNPTMMPAPEGMDPQIYQKIMQQQMMLDPGATNNMMMNPMMMQQQQMMMNPYMMQQMMMQDQMNIDQDF